MKGGVHAEKPKLALQEEQRALVTVCGNEVE